MLEVACTVCGAVYRFPQADVPVGGKTVTCARCKGRIVVQAPPPALAMTGGTGDVINLGPGAGADGIDLPVASTEIVDLPAPKLAPPPPGVEIVDLPAPKLVPRAQAEALTLDSIDLLAPVGPTRSRPPAPAPLLPADAAGARARHAQGDAIPDLPAPKRSSEPVRPSFAPPMPSFAVPAIPSRPAAARAPAGPAAPAAPAPAPGPIAPGDIPDLPMPKFGGPARDLFDDLPARGPSLADLPTPKRPSIPSAPATPGAPGAQPDAGVTDLPAPKGFFDDLPRPAPNAANRESSDLPAPKGFFDDLPQPAPNAANRGSSDLPAPKGFFDDLPQPASAAANRGSSDLPAPKGFFDDLPQPAGPGRPDLPAPKGFFEDLPQSANQAHSDVPVPKGFFDDLPQPGYAASGVDLPVPPQFFDEQPLRSAPQLDDLDRAREQHARGAEVAPPLDLGEDNLSGLDLPDAGPIVAATRTGVVQFRGGGDADDDGGSYSPPRSATSELDLAAPPRRDVPPAPPPRLEPVPLAPRRNLRRIVAIAALGLALAGAGGYTLYDRWQTKKARAAAIERDLSSAHKALLAGDPGHWTRAVNAARGVLERAPKHTEALATAAVAHLAGYVDQGTNREARLKAGRGLLEQARLASAKGSMMTMAVALDALVEGNAQGAIERLTPIAADEPEALLYLGWAELAASRWDEAAATFDKAAAATPGRKLAATYGRGQALLGKGDLEGARAAFLEVIALDAEHVGAQVGVAAAMPAADFLKRETELLAILQRPKLDTVDPRVRARAWTLAANDARSAGRLDAARERYRQALELVPTDVGVMVAAAALELRDGKLDLAATGIEQALGIAADDVEANLVKIELDIRSGELEAAATRLQALRDRTPPITGAAPRGQIELLDGHRLAAAGDTTAALTAYGKAREILGAGDIAPTIAIATLLGKMANAADKDGKPAEAVALRARATSELAEVAGAAAADPALAVTLGVAYLDAGGLADAERWLRTAVAARPTDVEARFQLAEGLRRAGKTSEAIDTLREASELAPARVDLGVALARAYEAADRDPEAAKAYARLLEGDDKPDTAAKISIDVRARAGRFFARAGDLLTPDLSAAERLAAGKVAAGKQGTAILAVEARNATGLFLAGEGLLAAGKLPEARQSFQRAVDQDPDPQFADGLGRAYERIFLEKNDTVARDEALRAYNLAVSKAPDMVNAHAGAGRMYLARRDYDEAIVSLGAADSRAPSAELAGAMGQAYAARGGRTDQVEAIRLLERAARGNPPGETLYMLGDLYDKTNRGPAAAAMWTRATEIGQREEKLLPTKLWWLDDAYRRLGQLQDSLGNLAAACQAYSSYLRREPQEEIPRKEAEKAKNVLCR